MDICDNIQAWQQNHYWGNITSLVEILCGMGSVQVRLQLLILLPIMVALPVVLEGEPLGRIQGNPRCGSLLGIFGTKLPRNFYLVSSCTSPYLVSFISGIRPWKINASSWCWHTLSTVWFSTRRASGCIGSIIWSRVRQFLFFVISNPKVAYLFSIYMHCHFEHCIWVSLIVRSLGADPGPVGVCQYIVGILGLGGLPRRFSPHEVGVSIAILVVHKYSGFPEPLVSAPLVWDTNPVCAEIIWSVEVVFLCLVSDVFLIDPSEFFP